LIDYNHDANKNATYATVHIKPTMLQNTLGADSLASIVGAAAAADCADDATAADCADGATAADCAVGDAVTHVVQSKTATSKVMGNTIGFTAWILEISA
jgi:hypothetical protein